jgi:hypothetical protein
MQKLPIKDFFLNLGESKNPKRKTRKIWFQAKKRRSNEFFVAEDNY